MFDILSVEFSNFGSYSGTHNFTFPQTAGLYSLTGKNDANPRLGANGCGKSTLIQAVRWCFYGRTSRGLKAGDVVTWGHKGCFVAVRAAIGDRTVAIRRAQHPNSLTVTDGTQTAPIDQIALEKLLRLLPQAFDYAVAIPQFGESFFDLSPGDKLALFSEIMGLDYWLERSGEAAEITKELDEALAANTAKQAKLSGQIELLEAELPRLTAQEADFDGARDIETRELKTKIKEWVRDEDFYLRDQAGIEAVLKGNAVRIAKLTAEAKAVGAEATQNDDTIRKISAIIEDAEEAIVNLETLGAHCPTCQQAVDKDHCKKEKQKLTAQIGSDRFNLGKFQHEHERLLKEASLIARDLNTVNRNTADFERKLLDAQRQVTTIKARREEAEARLAREARAGNPFTKMIHEKYDAVTELTAKLQKRIDAMNELSIDRESVAYWVQGFKRVRLFLVEQTLRQLEVEVNNGLTSLGLVGWEVKFDVERENKAGGVTKGFAVFVTCPDHDQPIKFEAWSGGETQRLRLAGNLGLANLIMERAGLVGQIEFHDEFSAHMAEEGIVDAVETLQQRAAALGKKVWVVDHHVLDSGAFEAVYCAHRTTEGTKLTRM